MSVPSADQKLHRLYWVPKPGAQHLLHAVFEERVRPAEYAHEVVFVHQMGTGSNVTYMTSQQ